VEIVYRSSLQIIQGTDELSAGRVGRAEQSSVCVLVNGWPRQRWRGLWYSYALDDCSPIRSRRGRGPRLGSEGRVDTIMYSLLFPRLVLPHDDVQTLPSKRRGRNSPVQLLRGSSATTHAPAFKVTLSRRRFIVRVSCTLRDFPLRDRLIINPAQTNSAGDRK